MSVASAAALGHQSLMLATEQILDTTPFGALQDTQGVDAALGPDGPGVWVQPHIAAGPAAPGVLPAAAPAHHHLRRAHGCRPV